MALTPKEAFRTGFLTRCAEEGLDDNQLEARIKRALDVKHTIDAMGEASPEHIKEAEGGIVKLLLKSPLLAMAIGGVGGAGLGVLAAKARNAADPEFQLPKTSQGVKDIQTAELVSTYNREAEAAKLRNKMLQRKKKREEEEGPSRFRVI
tara:strand:- start:8121 stop:8570 length:450 start_codon:yes stop_codon:yes gene_type:complete